MQKLSFLILSLFFLLALGCQKVIHHEAINHVLEEYQGQNNLRKSNLRSQLTSGTYMGALVGYQNYTALEKFLLWKDKLEDALERKTLTDNQRAFIENCLSSLSESYFTNPPSEEVQMNMMNQANTLFGSGAEASKVFCTPFDFDETPPFIDVTNEIETINCHCKWSLICEMNNIGSCNGPGCSATSWGCGWFWGSPCTFVCDETPTL